MVSKKVFLPPFEELEVEEVNVTSANLMAVAPYLGKYCEEVNNEFMLCRTEMKDPRFCYRLGKKVTECTLYFLSRLKKYCIHEHEQYMNCVDKSSGDYRPWPCRKTHDVYRDCIKKNFGIEYPGFGYFCRGRIHKTLQRAEPPPDTCPCFPPKKGDETKRLPDSRPRPRARFGGRSYYQTE